MLWNFVKVDLDAAEYISGITQRDLYTIYSMYPNLIRNIWIGFQVVTKGIFESALGLLWSVCPNWFLRKTIFDLIYIPNIVLFFNLSSSRFYKYYVSLYFLNSIIIINNYITVRVRTLVLCEAAMLVCTMNEYKSNGTYL